LKRGTIFAVKMPLHTLRKIMSKQSHQKSLVLTRLSYRDWMSIHFLVHGLCWNALRQFSMVITEPSGLESIRLNVPKEVTIRSKEGDDIYLPCLAQGNPPPNYS
jgi:hypothetical protein